MTFAFCKYVGAGAAAVLRYGETFDMQWSFKRGAKAYF